MTTYVATGGTAPLTPLTPPPIYAETLPPSMIRGFWEKLPPNQQMIATILSFIFSVPVLGVLAGGRLAGLAAILMPLGIIWSVLYFRAKQREFEQRRAPQMGQMYTPPPTAFHTPAQPTTAYTPPPAVVQTPLPRTNPLAESASAHQYVPPSVTEQETQPLPPPRQAQ